MDSKLNNIHKTYAQKISQADSLKALDEIFLELFGKSVELTLLPKDFPKLKKEEVREIGYKKLEKETLNLSKKIAIKKREGHKHPLSDFGEEIAYIFSKLGFEQYDAPQIDTDENNFGVLNIPEEHPARDLWDTLYLDYPLPGPNLEKLLLRTHTSNSQVRIMKELKLPIRMMTVGRCFRYENVDARHEHTFEQFELVYIDKNLSMANLLYLSEYFFQAIFGYDVKARLKPKYYPFVEPGAGVDGLCIFCKGKGCKVCGGVGWLELAGAGVI